MLGRVRRIHRVGRQDDPHYALSLEFTDLIDGDASARIHTALIRLQPLRNVARTFTAEPEIQTSRRDYGFGSISGSMEKTTSIQEIDHGVEGLENFYVRGERFRLENGFQMTWRVVKP